MMLSMVSAATYAEMAINNPFIIVKYRWFILTVLLF
jgi:hypothetical protein